MLIYPAPKILFVTVCKIAKCVIQNTFMGGADYSNFEVIEAISF